MKHRTTRALYDYWRRCRATARATPSRADIEPSDIHALLGDTFILECDRPNTAPFRLAGTRVCLLFNRELKGADFFGLWRPQDRDEIAQAFHTMRADAACHVFTWKGHTESDYQTGGEMLLLPLTMGGAEVARALGCMVPFELPVWLGAVPLITLELRDSYRIDLRPDHQLPPSPGSTEDPPDSRENVRRVGHLSVYAGGLQDD